MYRSATAVSRTKTRNAITLAAWALGLILAIWTAGARGATIAEIYPQARSIFPHAERFGPLEGEPPAAGVFAGGQLIGYLFLTSDVVRIPAYSGKPINTLVGFDLSGRIAGLAIVQHDEPILAAGVSEIQLRQFTDQYRSLSVGDRVTVGTSREGHVAIDTISGATITAMVQNQTVMLAARLIAESRGLLPPVGIPAAASPPTPHNPLAGHAQGSPVPGWTTGPSAQAPAAEPLWRGTWQERAFRIAVLTAGLAVLTLILVFQDFLAQRPRLLAYLRRGFLIYTVAFIGWYALAQLSVIHVLSFLHAVMRDFRWEVFLVDPMIFILWSFTAVTLLLWGRGVFCGWLCPYGALQELIQQVAQRCNVRQLEFPQALHERLWAVKYIVLLFLFAVSLQSLGDASVYAEVEPFRTAFTLRFQREWPFVLYASGMLLVSAFNRKFFCKYLCPLGAALTIPGRFRIFDWWLRRRRECGRPCQICAHECEVRAIRPTGEINANECHYCLDCQVTYFNAYKCPPLVDWRRRRERASRTGEIVCPIEPSQVLQDSERTLSAPHSNRVTK